MKKVHIHHFLIVFQIFCLHIHTELIYASFVFIATLPTEYQREGNTIIKSGIVYLQNCKLT